MDELKTIIFRTDRIGDFIISYPFISAYKKKFPHNQITIISSDYNFEHINKFEIISKTIPLKSVTKFFPKLFILMKMIILLRKNTYKDIIVLDGKARSFFISLFLKGNKSILLHSKKILLWSWIFNYKSVVNNEIQSQLKNFSFLANLIGFKIKNKNPNIYKNLDIPNNLKLNKDYIILHLDEKWFSKMYYRDFTDINPSTIELENFINKILKILDNKFTLVLTSGNKKIENLESYVDDFKSNDNFIFQKTINNQTINYYKNLSFDQLTMLVSNSKLLICCEGAISHLSNNFNIKTFAFYEKKRFRHTMFWTGHMKKISLFERKPMNKLLLDDNFYNVIKKSINNL